MADGEACFSGLDFCTGAGNCALPHLAGIQDAYGGRVFYSGDCRSVTAD